VGLGRAFSLMRPTFLHDARIQLCGGYDPRSAASALLAQEFAAIAYDSLDQLCADPRTNVVYVSSPQRMHAEHVERIAASGKHILLEKPMALSVAECDRMVAVCSQYQVQLLVGHCHSFDTPYRVALQTLQSGRMGRIHMVHGWNFTDFVYRPRYPEELDPAQGGGAILNQGAHQIDIVRMLIGSPLRSVRACAGNWDAQRPTQGAYSAMLFFDNGSCAHVAYSGYAHFDSDIFMGHVGEMGHTKLPHHAYGARRSQLAGVSRAAEAAHKHASSYGGTQWATPPTVAPHAHQHFGPLIISCELGDIRPLPDAVELYLHDRVERIELPAPAIARQEVIDELYAACIEGHPTLHDGTWARDTVRACLAIQTSAREGRELFLHELQTTSI
jgi:phthalate 4,5-cis-dihydrodiol dehydrogenase